MRDAIEEVPDGSWSHEVKMDGINEPLTIQGNGRDQGHQYSRRLHGTSPQIEFPLNSVPNYTYAYTVYPVRTALCPGIPNNDGVLRPITVSAPPGSLLNPTPPAPVGQRHITGHFCCRSNLWCACPGDTRKGDSRKRFHPCLHVCDRRREGGW